MEYYKLVQAKVRTVTNQDLLRLPQGFRFHPTDEELILHYLIPKALNRNFTAPPICQADFNKCEPWDLPKKENMGESERYYYCQRDRKYPSGLRTNRATKAGYWKATGKDKEIYKGVGASKECIGMKKTLVFYTGRAPNGEKTNWVMHEFRLQQNGQFSFIPKDDGWVISRVFHKINTNCGNNDNRTRMDIENNAVSPAHISDSLSTDRIIDNNESLPDLVDPSHFQTSNRKAMMTISNICHFNNSSIDAYDDPGYSFPSLSETLFETLDSHETTCAIIDEYKCKKDQKQCASSSAINAPLQDTSSKSVEVLVDGQEYDDDLIPLSSTLSSMPDLLKLWD